MDPATGRSAAPGGLSPESQAQLASRVRQGETAAEEELVLFFQPRVLMMMLARTRDREAARDLAQETLVAVVVALRAGQLREAERLAAFVHGTARNLANNYFRSRAPEGIPIAPGHAVADPADALETAERTDHVRRALARLGPTDRRILLLTLVEGLKPGEIAERLGLGSEVVRARKSRAIKKVADQMKTRHGLLPIATKEEG